MVNIVDERGDGIRLITNDVSQVHGILITWRYELKLIWEAVHVIPVPELPAKRDKFLVRSYACFLPACAFCI